MGTSTHSSRVRPHMNQQRSFLILRLLLLCLLSYGSQPLLAQQQDPALALDPAVTRGVLQNGLTYYIRENHYPENRAVMWLVVNAGSVLEDDDQLGLAHFVEHMAFNGTRRFEKNSMIDFAERAGINFGADLNAFTSYDETVYMLTVPSDDSTVLNTGLDILEDWASGLTFDPVEVDKERGVVIEEWRRTRGAGQRISDQQRELLLQDSRYASRNTIGEKDILEHAPVATLRRFYDDWYRPELMAVVVVGAIDKDMIEKEITRRFAGLGSRGRHQPRTDFDIPLVQDTRVSVLSDPEANRSGITLAIKGPRSDVHSETDYRHFLVQTLFTMTLNARLDELRRNPGSPLILAFTGVSELGRSLDVMQLTAVPKPEMFNESLAVLLTELERVRRYGFTQPEIDRQKASLLSFYQQAYAEKDRIDSGSFARESMDHYLKQETMPGIQKELELVMKHMPDISLAEIENVAESWSQQQDRLILASGPERDIMPSPDALMTTAATAAAAEIDPYHEEAGASELLSDLPRPGTVTERAGIESIGVTTWTLSNGARVVIKPTDFMNDEILFQAFSPGGDSLADDTDYDSAEAAADIVFQAGLGQFSASDLAKMLAGKTAWVRPYINELEEGLSGRSTGADLETMLQLAYMSFTMPRRDEPAFETWRSRMQPVVRNRDLDPQRYFNQEYRAFSNNYHPRRMPMTEAQLDNVDLDKAYRFVQDRFSDAGGFTFVFTGNIDMQQLERLAGIYLASLPAAGGNETWRDIGVSHPEGVATLKIEKGSDPRSTVRMTWHGEMEWSVEHETDLQLLDDVIEMRLREVLREDMGGVYSTSSQGIFLRQPRQEYLYNIGFTCAPENVDSLRQAVFDIIISIQENGIGEDYLLKIREQRRRQLEVDLKQNGFWHSRLIMHYRYGTDPAVIESTEIQSIDRINSENIRNAARMFLGGDRIDGILMPAPAS